MTSKADAYLCAKCLKNQIECKCYTETIEQLAQEALYCFSRARNILRKLNRNIPRKVRAVGIKREQ